MINFSEDIEDDDQEAAENGFGAQGDISVLRTANSINAEYSEFCQRVNAPNSMVNIDSFDEQSTGSSDTLRRALWSSSISGSSTFIKPDSRDNHFVSTSETSSLPPITDSSPLNQQRGLRHFSLRVCKTVEQKGKTTYNEVAEALVQESILLRSSSSPSPSADTSHDDQNIRRRVYDALNVLMALDIIARDHKEIRWIGLPNSYSDQVNSLRREHLDCSRRIQMKKDQLNDLQLSHHYLNQLAAFNASSQANQANSSHINIQIPLPVMMIASPIDTRLDLDMADDMKRVMLQYSGSRIDLFDSSEFLSVLLTRIQTGLTT